MHSEKAAWCRPEQLLSQGSVGITLAKAATASGKLTPVLTLFLKYSLILNLDELGVSTLIHGETEVNGL